MQVSTPRYGLRNVAQRARAGGIAVAGAVLTELALDAGYSLARASEFDPLYVGLCGLLMAASGLACAGVAALLPGAGVRGALALYVALHGFVEPTSPSSQQLGGLAMAGVTWLLFAPSRAARIGGPFALGTIVSCALFGASVFWRYASAPLGIPTLAWIPGVSNTLCFAAVLLMVVAWARRRSRFPRLPTPASACALVSLLALAGTFAIYGALRPQARSVPPASAREAAGDPPPDVIVLVLDTVRADHLASYGYARDTMPNLERLLAEHPEAVRYELAFSPASWTVPSHASLLTGLMPSRHGARSRGQGEFSESVTSRLQLSAAETLAEVMHGAGYCTAAVLANATLLRVDGLQRGFDVYFQPRVIRPLLMLGRQLRRRFAPHLLSGRIKPYPSASSVNRELLRVRGKCGTRPAFLVANYMEAHSPFIAPPPHQGRFAGERYPPIGLGDAMLTDSPEFVALKLDRYDEALHYLDASLAPLFARLEESGALAHSWLFVTADHGEGFVEHESSSHGSSLYNEQVRIPLIVKPPRGVRLPPSREPVSLLDVATTIAAIAGRGDFGEGHDLRRPLPPGRAVAIEFRGGFRTSAVAYGAKSRDPARAVVREGWKLIESGGLYELYDLAADPRERRDLSPENGARVRELAAALPPPVADGGGDRDEAAGRSDLTPEELETLRALGYAE